MNEVQVEKYPGQSLGATGGKRQTAILTTRISVNGLGTVALIGLSLLLVLVAVSSISWRIEHDLPIMLYAAYLIDHFGYVPYRDIFDMNMPGTYLAYRIIGRLSGYTDFGIRCVDLSLLTMILVINGLWMKRLGWKIAWGGSVIWGLLYLGFGPKWSLQREFLILLPILLGAFIHTRWVECNSVFRNLAVGFCFGIAAIIKPPAAIGLPVLLALDPLRRQGIGSVSGIGKYLKQAVAPAFLGFAVPVLGALLYLWSKGATTQFLDIARNYWPLYTSLTGDHATAFGINRIEYFILNYRNLGGFGLWMVPAVISTYVALYHSALNESQKRQVVVLIALTCCYGIYPLFSGQFWDYHWLLFSFFIVQLSALALMDRPRHEAVSKRLVPVLALLFIVYAFMPLTLFKNTLLRNNVAAPKVAKTDEIVSILKKELRPEDKVQPLDWTGGAVHAMLILNTRLATPFLYDFHFYHHISERYIQNLRAKFISDLASAKPRFIIQMAQTKPRVSGVDTTRDFEELQSMLDAIYFVRFQGDGYVIYELRQQQVAAVGK